MGCNSPPPLQNLPPAARLGTLRAGLFNCMNLLTRAINNAFRIASSVTASTFTAWFPSTPGNEVAVSCIGGNVTRGTTTFAAETFMNRKNWDISILVRISDLPAGIPKESSTIWAGATTNKANATKYKIDSVKSLTQSADYIEIKATAS